MKTAWKERSLTNRIVTVVSILSSLAVIVLAILQMTGTWELAINLCVPMMGTTMLCQACLQWKASKAVAYANLGAAIIAFLCTAAVLLIK